MPKNWNRRFKHNREKIKTGDVFELAEVVRNLAIREWEKGLSTGEKQMYTRAKKILASEFMYALARTRRGPRLTWTSCWRSGSGPRRLPDRPSASAVIAAAGSGERLGAGGPKAFVELAGRPLIAWSLDAFARARKHRPRDRRAAAGKRGRRRGAACDVDVGVVAGGDRSESVAAGAGAGRRRRSLRSTTPPAPLVTPELIDELVRQARLATRRRGGDRRGPAGRHREACPRAAPSQGTGPARRPDRGSDGQPRSPLGRPDASGLPHARRFARRSTPTRSGSPPPPTTRCWSRSPAARS